MVLSKQKMQKINNQLALLQLIRSEQKTSQVELSVKTKLQPSTVSYLVRDFKQKGLVRVAGKGESGELGGKKSILLSFNAKHGVFSGIALKKKSIAFSLFDFSGLLINRKEISISGFSTQDILDVIITEINENSQKYANYKGVGIAVSSVINEMGDLVYSYGINLKVSHFQADIVARIPHIPLVVENDANCAAYYSNLFLKGFYKNLITYSVYLAPFCIGAGIIIENKLFKGFNGAAGEIWDSISEEHKAFDQLECNEISKNNEITQAFLKKIRDYILSTAVFIDTEAIILSGDIANFSEDILSEFIHSLDNTYNKFSVTLINNQEIVENGAAMLVIDSYIKSLLKGGAY